MKIIHAAVWSTLLAATSLGATFPTDFEVAGSELSRLYSYFGGVASFAVATSATPVYSGQSQRVIINFQPSSFTTNGVGLGSLGLAAPNLTLSAANNTFSISVKSPDVGTLACYVTIREDDNASGAIDIASGDDEWESIELVLQPGTNTYNIPYSSFTLTGEGSGNLIQNFNNTPRMAFLINFESRTTLPGGLLTAPTTIYLDHIGFFPGPQSPPPPPSCPGDTNGDRLVNGNDLSVLLATFGNSVAPGAAQDLNDDGVVNGNDLSVMLANFGLAC